MTLTPVGLFWPRPRLILLVLMSLGLGAAALLHRTPPPRPAIQEVRRFHYRVVRAAFLRESVEGLHSSCRIVPAMTNSRPAGLRVYAIRPNSVFAQLGIQNGDRVERVNGMAITSPDRAIEIYSRLRDARWVRVDVNRRGMPTPLFYELVD